MSEDAADIRQWARDAGIDVGRRGRVPQEVRDAYEAQLLPGPDDSPDDWPEEAEPAGPPPWVAGPEPEAAEPEELAPDEPPATIPRGRSKARGKRKPPPKTTAATRADIEGKVGILLLVPGAIWQARDPICGGAFVEATPAITDAGMDFILASPDLVNFFTGPGGEFMRYFKLAVAFKPVLEAIWAHHIAHTITTPEGEQTPARQYAA